MGCNNKRIAGVVFCALTVFLVLLTAGCGGSSSSTLTVPAAGDTGLRSGSGFSLAEAGPEQTAGLAVEVVPGGTTVLVRVSAVADWRGEAVLFELSYDPGAYAPRAAQATGAFAALDDSLCLEFLDTPGVVSFAQASLAGSTGVLEPGDVVAEVLFSVQPCAEVRAAAEVPVHSGALCPLTYNAATGGLTLYYNNPGDYDQNGVVSASDLVPLGRNFDAAGPFDYTTALSVVDGNNNGQIEVADISVIGQNWDHNVAAFNFYGSNSIDDVPVGYAKESSIEPLGVVDFASATGTPAVDRLQFGYQPATTAEFTMYWARPSADGSEGIASNLAGPNILTQLGGASNVQPTAQLELGYSNLEAPATVTLDAGGSSDIDGLIVHYEWDFEGDGLFDGSGDTPVILHTYNSPGTYAPRTKVIDNLGAWATAQAGPLVIDPSSSPNTAPVADLLVTADSGTAPLSVGFIASGSSDADGTIVKYEWDFEGDGTFELDSGSDSTVIHRYDNPGSYNPVLRVTDDRDATGTATLGILVESSQLDNDPPTAVLTADITSGDVPLMVSFDAGGSSDPDGSIVLYEWDFDGDGTFDKYGSSPEVSNTYQTAGSFAAAVRVVDDLGATASDETAITAGPYNSLPVANLTIGRSYGEARLYVEFDASESYDGDGSIVQYEWDIDGYAGVDSTTTIPYASYDYNVLGVKDVSVTVTDDRGGSATATDQVRILRSDQDTDSAWPMFGFNTRHTGRCQFTASPVDNLLLEVGLGYEATAPPAFGADGTIYLGCIESTSYTARMVAFNPDASVQWIYHLDDVILNSPAVGMDGTIYFGSRDDNLYALNPDGSEKWIFPTGGNISSSPVLSAGGSILFGSVDGNLYCLDSAGVMEWSYPTGGVAHTPVLAGGSIYFTSSDLNLYSLAMDGSLQWAYPVGSYPQQTPAIGGDGTIYIGTADEELHAVNPDGSQKWVATMDISTSTSQTSPAIGPGGEIYFGTPYGVLHAFDDTGTELWTYDAGYYFYGPLVIGSDGTIYVNQLNHSLHAVNPDGTLKWIGECFNPTFSPDGTLYAEHSGLVKVLSDGSTEQVLDESGTDTTPSFTSDGTMLVSVASGVRAYDQSGNMLWKNWDNAASDFATPAVQASTNRIVEVDPAGTVYCLDDAGAEIWSYNLGESTRFSPTIYGQRVYVVSNTGNLYAVENGTLIWSYQLPDEPGGPAAVDIDGSVYVTCDGHEANLVSIAQDGSLRWSYNAYSWSWSNPPVIADDGTIYIYSFSNMLYALTNDGHLKWTYQADNGSYADMPAVARDGTVYFLDRQYLYAVNPYGDLKWRFDTGLDTSTFTAPTIDGSGNVLFTGDGQIHMVNPSGELLYESPEEFYCRTAPVIAADGSVISCGTSSYFVFGPVT